VVVDFLDVLWSIIIIYFLITILFVLFTVVTDIFRDHSLSGGGKALWLLFLIVFPLVGLLVYLIVRHEGMRDRAIAAQKSSEKEFASYVQSVATTGGAADEIAKAKDLLDSGAISQGEFDAIKAKAIS
jgi:Short C-terminal domain/Phospholipase_D-nuclease N-terminal